MTAPAQPSQRSTSGRPEPKPGIDAIAIYVGGKSKAPGIANPIKLSSNENVLGCSPDASAAYVSAGEKLNIYPDGHAGALREAVAAQYGLEPERLVFGCGSGEIFPLLNQLMLEPGDNIVQHEYGFATYAISARACQAEVRFAPEPKLVIDVDEMLAQVDERTRVMFLANPSNPTGSWLAASEVRRLHAGLRSDVLLVLDAAYAEFATDPGFEDGLDLARGAENIVVSHTFSKLHGLAAARVGWAYCPAHIALAYERIRPPFNVSLAGQLAAIAALGDHDFQRRSVELVERWRPWLTQQLGGLGLEPLPSQANFILVRFPGTPGRTAAEAEAFMASRGVLVRYTASYDLPDCLRITVGLEEHNRAVIDALSDFLAG
jgi:histidinol-phosphate aminotransferase